MVAAVGDPNPRTSGRGFEYLRESGVEVALGPSELAWRARVQNEGFRTWVALGRPFVSYKAALTLDGRVAAAGGGSRWISGEESRRVVHQLRARSDAVAVGMGTVRAESPLLTARGVEVATHPRRIAFGSGPLPPGSELELRSGALDEELRQLAEEGVQTLLLEGGPTLAGAFLREGAIDRLVLFLAPKLIGGDDALPLFVGPGVRSPAEALPLTHLTVEPVGEDVLLIGYLREP